MYRWIIAAVVAFAIIALIAYARGPRHHHGDEVGSLPSPVPVVSVGA
ncbi:hypothetical protein [Hamadaea tsunoensis]|nr:hypothetical protein [Hamadaea tsunoensis]